MGSEIGKGLPLQPWLDSVPSGSSPYRGYRANWAQLEQLAPHSDRANARNYEGLANFDVTRDGSYLCKLCHKLLKSKYTACQHYEDTHLDAGYHFVCSHCPSLAPCATRNALYQHMRKIHNLLLKKPELDAMKHPAIIIF